MKKTTNYYAVRHSSGTFSEKTTIGDKNIETIEEAKKVIDSFCSTSNPEYKGYWASQRPKMKVFKVSVTEIEINLKP